MLKFEMCLSNCFKMGDGEWNGLLPPPLELRAHIIMRHVFQVGANPDPDEAAARVREMACGPNGAKVKKTTIDIVLADNEEFLLEVRKVALMLWAYVVYQYSKYSMYSRMMEFETKDEGRPLRRKLNIDETKGERMGFSRGELIVYQMFGDAIFDSSTFPHLKHAYGFSAYLGWPLVRNCDGAFFYVFFKFEFWHRPGEARNVPFVAS